MRYLVVFLFFFGFVCLFVRLFFSPHLLILPGFPCSVPVLSRAGLFALGERSRSELRLWVALQYHLINVLGSCISVQPAEIVPMDRWLNFQNRRGDWAAAVLFEPLLQEVDVFSIFVHLIRDQTITDRKLGCETRRISSYEFLSFGSLSNDNGTKTTPQINDIIGWMRTNNHAAHFDIHSFDIVCQTQWEIFKFETTFLTTTWACTSKVFLYQFLHENHFY